MYSPLDLMRPCFYRVLVVLLMFAAPARADSYDDAKARSLYERGMAHFQLDEYDVAIQLWQQGFRIKPAPEFLYNIAQAYRFSNERALTYYKKYLNLNPRAPNRAEVEHHIEVLTRLLSEQQSAASAAAATPPAKAVTPAAAVVKPPAVVLAPPVPRQPAAAPQPALLASAPAPAPAPESLIHKDWFWGTLAAGAAVIAVGVGVGVGVGGKSSDPNASFGIARGN